ncbi:MAG TPA: M20/M25/M40 family metallo-hydrolase [Nitrospiraceae bacterium]|nr:M20/M25/M40 family metallo-hydrolase [Nitrospiraceae bacterium]
MADVRRLSSEEFNGRQTGTPEDLSSAWWVAERWRTLGLLPLVPAPLRAGTAPEGSPGQDQALDQPFASLVQPWMMGTQAPVFSLPAPPILQTIAGNLVTTAVAGPDYLPLLDSPSVDLQAPVSFVGYGISDPAQGYDEYQGLDVKGRVVVFLRSKPAWYERPVSHAEKIRTAQSKGAVGYLTVTGPVMSPYEARRGVGTNPLAYYGGQDLKKEQALPGAWASPALVESILHGTGREQPFSLQTVQEQIQQKRLPRSRQADVQLRLRWESTTGTGTLCNVVGIIEGKDPSLRHEAIVIGAHRDHFGRQGGLLFPGADDNASGTAVILEVARLFMESGAKPARSLVFVSFSGEEQGLWGSKLYVERPPRPLAQTKAMINIDHAGIGNGRLTVGVTGLDKSVAARAGEQAELADKLDLFGFFPGGDHVPFKEAGVPTVTVVSGGPHPHFHQAGDRIETINPEVLLSATRYVLALAWSLADQP